MKNIKTIVFIIKLLLLCNTLELKKLNKKATLNTIKKDDIDNGITLNNGEDEIITNNFDRPNLTLNTDTLNLDNEELPISNEYTEFINGEDLPLIIKNRDISAEDNQNETENQENNFNTNDNEPIETNNYFNDEMLYLTSSAPSELESTSTQDLNSVQPILSENEIINSCQDKIDKINREAFSDIDNYKQNFKNIFQNTIKIFNQTISLAKKNLQSIKEKQENLTKENQKKLKASSCISKDSNIELYLRKDLNKKLREHKIKMSKTKNIKKKANFRKKIKILNAEIKEISKKKNDNIDEPILNQEDEDLKAAKFISDTISKAALTDNQSFSNDKEKLSNDKNQKIEQEAMDAAKNIISEGRAIAEGLELSGISEAIESALEETSQHEAEIAKKGIVIGSKNLKDIINSQINRISPLKLGFLKKKNKKRLKLKH